MQSTASISKSWPHYTHYTQRPVKYIFFQNFQNERNLLRMIALPQEKKKSHLKARGTVCRDSPPQKNNNIKGLKQRGGEAKLVLQLVQTSKQPSAVLLAPAVLRRALFPLDTGLWLAASEATGSVNALTSAPVPGKEVIYFCKSNRKKPTGKRKKSDARTRAQLWSPEGPCLKPCSFHEWLAAMNLL